MCGNGSGFSYIGASKAEVTEIKDHLHNWERWFGLAAVPDAELHRADPAGDGGAAFQIDAGNNVFGAWVQIMGSDDTPAISGQTEFDMRRLEVCNTERDFTYILQIAFGETAAGALSAGEYTEIIFCPTSNQVDAGPVIIKTKPVIVGTKVWARCICPGQDTATLDFYFGIHEYS